ncbi:MAG: pilus assembly protein PilP [Desulfosarcinaceae bacterium]|nr:pilus assembly protein PilP [Desulfosarcinaceae bacterium]
MKPIRSILCILFFLVMASGCAEKAAPPPKPTVVSKKISTPAKPSVAEVSAQSSAAAAKPQAEPSPAASSTSKADDNDSEVKKHTAELLASVQKDEAAGARADSYSPKGKPDPFAPLFRDEPEQAAASTPVVARTKRKKRIPTTPLEKVDLSQLKLVATIRSHNGNAALVEDASGKGFIVKRGTYIGINSGSVVQIVKDRIVVEEEIETLLGEISLQKRELKLQKPPGE